MQSSAERATFLSLTDHEVVGFQQPARSFHLRAIATIHLHNTHYHGVVPLNKGENKPVHEAKMYHILTRKKDNM